MKKYVRLTLCCAAAVMLASGCGKKSDTAEETTTAASETQAEITDKGEVTKLGQYKGVEVTKQDTTVTEADLDQRIASILKANPEVTEITDRPAQKGDTVNIDYVGMKDGEAFDGGTAEGYDLELGSGVFIDGFEDGLIGKNVGETVELNLTFPEDYSNNTDLAGKAVVFTVTINSIDTEKEMVYDDMTDEYVSENFGNKGISTVDDLKSQVSSVLENRNHSSKMTEIQSGVLQKLLDECEVTLPDGLLDQRIAEYKERVNNAVEKSGKSFEDYMGMSEDDFNNQVSDYIEESLKQELILEAVVKDMNLSVSQKNFEEFVDSYVSSYNIADRDTFYKEYGGEDYIRLSYAENQALSKIMESVKTKVADNTDASDDADSSADAE